MDKYVIGLDNGGTLSKAALFDLKGREMAVYSKSTPVIHPRPGYTERDMEDLWESNCECIRGVLGQSKIDPERVIGLAVSGHGKGLYAWGKDGKPACRGIVSTDNRAWEYPRKWKNDGTWERLYSQLCQELIPGQQAALLAWMKDHEPRVYENIRWVFPVKDYIRFRLTGEACYEATDISGSGLMNVKNASFDRDLLEELGIGEVYDKLAPLKYSSERCGSVTEEAARLTGLKTGTPVAGGMFDIDSCAVAMDITSPELLCTITGTWSINEFISETPLVGTQIAMNSLYAIPGFYLLEECSPTGAGNLEWIIKNLIADSHVPEGRSVYQYIEDRVSSIDPEECDVYYLPFLYGSNTHPLGKATFAGLTSFHDKGHMLRAVYEGVAFSHKMHIDRLLSAREAPRAVRMAGGAAKSPLWVQMFADVLGLPIETVSGTTELGALGCAMAAAVCAGEYGDYAEAARSMVRINEPVMPDGEKRGIYRKKYEKYRAITEALDGVWEKFTV